MGEWGKDPDVATILSEVVEIEEHLHNRERWFGISADQSGNDWALDTLNPYRAISGDNAYGTDANDAAKVLGSADTPVRSGMSYFDLHRIFLAATNSNTPWKLRVIWGTGTMAAAISAGQYSEFVVAQDDANPQQGVGTPVDVIMPRVAAGTQAWVQAWNATNNATIDFMVGLHEYEE